MRIITPIVLLVGLGFSGIGHAQQAKSLNTPSEQTIFFDLPRQPLRQCLLEFAIQSQLTIVIEPSTVKGLESKPLIGAYPPELALNLLLSRSPLTYRIQEGAVVIEPKKDVVPQEPDEVEETVSDTIEEVFVYGRELPYRYSTISQSRLYGNVSSFDTSRFINVIPKELLVDQSPDDISAALRNSASITPADGLADTNDDFFIRGFPRFGLFVDGFRLSSEAGTKQVIENIERIEVLKGPSTLMFGQSEPGGIVNVVRKKPEQQDQFGLWLKTGTDGLANAALDANSAQTFGLKQIDTRLVASYQTQETFRSATDLERALVAPSVHWQVNENNAITVAYEGQTFSQIHNERTVILTPFGETQQVVSIEAPPSQRSPNYKAEHHLFDIAWQKQLSDNFVFRTQYFGYQNISEGVRATRSALEASGILVDPGDGAPDVVPITIGNGVVLPVETGTTVTIDNSSFKASLRSLYDEYRDVAADHIRASVEGLWVVGAIENDLKLGISGQRNQSLNEFTLESREDIQSVTQSSGFVQGEDVVSAVLAANADLGELTTREEEQLFDEYGVYAYNSARLNDQWRFSLGGRYSYTLGDVRTNESDAFESLNDFEGLSAEVGLKYEPTEDVAFFLNYSEGFKANYQIDDFKTVIPEPELSNQVELGLKAFLPDSAGLVTVSVYEISKRNIVSINYENGFRKAEVAGEQISQGLDLEFVYQLNTNLELIGSLGYLNAFIHNGEDVGNWPRLTAEYTGSLFINYRFKSGALDGLALSLGGFFVDDRYSNNENTNILPGYEVLDFSANYDLPVGSSLLQLRLAVKNLLDEPYTLSSEYGIRSLVEPGMRSELSIGMRF